MTTTRRVAILGSTGSIGRQAIEVVRALGERFEVVALVAGRNEHALRRQASELGVDRVGLGSDAAAVIAGADEVDIVLNAVVGAAGLRASLAALESGKVLALANKESLVAGGELCVATAARHGGRIVPVDSEHAAIAQCLEGRAGGSVASIVLTASGGPFRARHDLGGVTPEEALEHPTWSMGPKITIDCATLMNKGLEVLEAHFLFAMPYDRIKVLVHPQSVVHGIVELVDGTVLMQAATTDMRVPIQAALTTPERVAAPAGVIDLAGVRALEFEPLDEQRFPAVALAYDVGRAGLSYPAVLNAANEAAVRSFLDHEIGFNDIVAIVRAVVESHDPLEAGELEAILEVDSWARARAKRFIGSRPSPAPVASRLSIGGS